MKWSYNDEPLQGLEQNKILSNTLKSCYAKIFNVAWNKQNATPLAYKCAMYRNKEENFCNAYYLCKENLFNHKT